jgi:hypothetical protein
MHVNKITEVVIYESPDGGRTVYARKPGQNPTDRKLHWQDPQYQLELAELEQQKKWIDIFHQRKDNPELDRLCEQVELYVALLQK